MEKQTGKTSRGRKRLAGRPAEKQSIGREGVLEATLALLRSTPPDDLTLLDIAQQVGVDPALIRYYFGNKNGLLRAATLHLMDVTQLGSRALMDDAPINELLRRRIQMIIDIGRQNPHFLQLVMREIYFAKDQGGKLASETMSALQTTASRGVELAQAILDARPGHAPQPEIDPRFLHVAMLGACTFVATARPLFDVLFEPHPGEDALVARYADFLTDLLLRGICASPPPGVGAGASTDGYD